MSEWMLFWFSCGFFLGLLLTLLCVVAFWASETRRFYKRIRADEHATKYTHIGTRPPKY